MELILEVIKKACSNCEEFKSLEEFYRQGERYESLCKCCKQKARDQRKTKSSKVLEKIPIENPMPIPSGLDISSQAATYEEFGLTRETFLELVDFYRELFKLDSQRRIK